MANKTISLSIYGNRTSNDGFVALIVFGPYDVKIKDEATLINEEDPVYKIKHTAESILYFLHSTKVTSHVGQRLGTLVINLAIPADCCLAENRSPYELLKRIYSKFLADNATQDSTGIYRFKEGEYDREPFKDIINEYPLVQRTTRYVEMKGTQKATVCAPNEEALKALFLDSQYGEFANYSEIEIGNIGNPTLQIEIPRKPVYEIYVNGLSRDYSVSDEAEAVTETVHNSLLPFYKEYKPIRFTLYDLLNSFDGTACDGMVKIDKAGERINCTIQPVDKVITYQTKLRAKEGVYITEEDWRKIKNELQLTIHGTDVTKHFIEGSVITLTGEANENVALKNQKEISGFELMQDISNETITLFFKKKPVIKNGPNMITKDDNKKENSDLILQVDIDAQNECSIEIKDTEQAFLLCQPLRFEETGKIYKSTRNKVRSVFIPLEKSWKNKVVFVEIFRNNKTDSCESKITLDKNVNQLIVKSSFFKECKVESPAWYIRRSTLTAIIAAVCFIGGIVLGGVASHYIWGNTTEADSIKADSTQTAKLDSVPVEASTLSGDSVLATSSQNNKSSSNTSREVSSADIKRILQDNNLTFAEVDNLAKSHPNDALVQSYKKLVDKIRDKKKGILVVETKDISELSAYQKYAITGITFGQKINMSQCDSLQKEKIKPFLTVNTSTIEYNRAQKTSIKMLLNDKSFSSFKELTAFHKTILYGIISDNIR